jgi:hypothetical protein
MRTHSDIIDKPSATAARLFPELPGRWSDASALANTVKAWKRGDSIPGEYWPAFERAGLATVRALADAAEAKRLTRGAAQADAA